jgi:hypothetical protein
MEDDELMNECYDSLPLNNLKKNTLLDKNTLLNLSWLYNIKS